jgi:hypothetical protein
MERQNEKDGLKINRNREKDRDTERRKDGRKLDRNREKDRKTERQKDRKTKRERWNKN